MITMTMITVTMTKDNDDDDDDAFRLPIIFRGAGGDESGRGRAPHLKHVRVLV